MLSYEEIKRDPAINAYLRKLMNLPELWGLLNIILHM